MFADKCDVTLPGLDTKRRSVQTIRYLIRTEAQAYRAMPLILHPTSAVLVRQAGSDGQKIVVQGLVIRAVEA